jgi:DNA-binding XRE family transcriptional regulator
LWGPSGTIWIEQVAEPLKVASYRNFERLENMNTLHRNQLGRRNITLACRCELAEKLAEALKPKAKENQRGGQGGILLPPILAKAIDARERAAKEAGVSHGSMAAFKSKGWTQERIGEVLGVTRQAIALWIIPNASTCNASTPKPKDCRLKLSKEHCHTQEEIAKRVGLGKMGILDVCKQIEKFQIAYKPSDFDHL